VCYLTPWVTGVDRPHRDSQDLLIEADCPCIRPYLRALVEPGRTCGQIGMFERLEMALGNPGLSSDPLEREAAIFACAPEQLTQAGTAVVDV
jgi:hypothetical protein